MSADLQHDAAELAEERSLAPIAGAPAVVDGSAEPAMIRLALGGMPLVIDGARLEELLRATMPEELGGVRKPGGALGAMPAGLGGLELVEMGLRGAAIAALPIVRKLMAAYAPNYPPPSPPRRSDVLRYLIGYFIRLARDKAEAQTWHIEVIENERGEIEITGVRAATVDGSTGAPTPGDATGGAPTRGR